MANEVIRSDDVCLNELKKALETAGEDYIQNLAKLTNLINDITSGSIVGDPATDLKELFEEKQSTFKNITTTIEEAAEYTGAKVSKFSSTMDAIKSGMH